MKNNLIEIGGYSFLFHISTKKSVVFRKRKRRLWDNVAYLTHKNGVQTVI